MRQELDIDQCKEIVVSENYLDLIMDIRPGIENIARELDVECYQELTPQYGVFHFKRESDECKDFYYNSAFNQVPNVYGLTSTRAMDASGITSVLQSKTLDLTGNGVIVAILDTGIDYAHEAFRYEDNTTKILSIWDQTIVDHPPEGFLYGTEYNSEQINEALLSDNPYAIVPSTDSDGHGTFLAGLTAGRPNPIQGFQGAAPDADLIIVKLKQAKKCLMDFYQFNQEVIAWQTNDIMQGLNYITKKTEKLNKPVVILFAGGSTEGPHTGTAALEEVLARLGNFYGVGVITSAGNEGNTANHFYGQFDKDHKKMDIQLHVANEEEGLFMMIWGHLPDKLRIELISPSGYSTGPFPFLVRQWQNKMIPIEDTIVNVYYDIMEERSAAENIAIILENPVGGVWNIIVHGDVVVDGQVDIWLPLNPFINDDTFFLNPDPYDTIVNPSTNEGTITVGGYDDTSQSLYLGSSRGYTRNKKLKPDLVAPAVNVLGPYPRNQYTYQSGTSVGTAITAGAAALLLEWGIVQGNDELMNNIAIKSYLARGARRKRILVYPNREWGYGELNLINTFSIL